MSEETEPINLTPSPSVELSTSTEYTNQEEKKEKFDIEKQNELKITEILYGNDYKIKNPKKLGNSFVFWYIKDWPLITIGPDCIYFFYLIR